MSDAVVYFSCSGNSKLAAERLAEKLNYPVSEISKINFFSFNKLIVVFPVHCQSAPLPVIKFLKSVSANYYTLVATYGKAHTGNALWEATKYTDNRVCAAAYIPATHTYNSDGTAVSVIPEALIEKIKNPEYISVPKLSKYPFASFFPRARSRMLIKIKRDNSCSGCNACGNCCPFGAMNKGKPNGKCARCLKCVYNCPNKALYIKKGFILKSYLKNRYDKTILYV